MPERDDWHYLKITPELLREVERLKSHGLTQEDAAELLAEHFREKLLRVLWASELPG
jgi:hypothetical protein